MMHFLYSFSSRGVARCREVQSHDRTLRSNCCDLRACAIAFGGFFFLRRSAGICLEWRVGATALPGGRCSSPRSRDFVLGDCGIPIFCCGTKGDRPKRRVVEERASARPADMDLRRIKGSVRNVGPIWT